MMDGCSKSLKIALKVHWFLQAEAEESDDAKELNRLLEKCQLAALMGDWPPLVRPKKIETSPGSRNRMLNKLLSSRRLLNITSSPPLQKVLSPGGAPNSVIEEAYKSIRESITFRRKEESRPRSGEEEKVDRKTGILQLGDEEGFFKRLFRDKVDDREKKEDREKLEEEEKVLPNVDEEESPDFFLFRRFLRVHPEDDDKAFAEATTLNNSESSPGTDGFFRRLFKDRNLEDDDKPVTEGTTLSSSESSPGTDGFFKRLFKDRNLEDSKVFSLRREDGISPSNLLKKLFKDKTDDVSSTTAEDQSKAGSDDLSGQQKEACGKESQLSVKNEPKEEKKAFDVDTRLIEAMNGCVLAEVDSRAAYEDSLQSCPDHRPSETSANTANGMSFDTELRTALSQIWVGDIFHTQGAAQLLASCIDASSTACGLTVSERRHLFSRERQLQDRLACIRWRLQEFPGNTFLGDMQRETVDTLTHLQEEKSEFTYHASVSTWISKADRMNNFFFSCFRQRPAGTMVRTLRDSMGQLHTYLDEILEMASVYYETLFTLDLLTRDVLDARDEVWSFVRPVVSGDMQTAIMRSFSLQEEVSDTVHGLDGASCPGDDGLTRQFFMQYWDLVSQTLQEASPPFGIREIMPDDMDCGMIPILARMITSRLRPFLPDLIHSSQIGFVQDRSILDNVVTFYEAVEWARQTGQPTAIMLLDFEKAYDRVEWGFLEDTLHRMGFPDALIRGISALYRSASAVVTIETMALYLRGRTPQIRGLHMPVDTSPDLVEQEYVDDTMIFCQYQESLHEKLKGIEVAAERLWRYHEKRPGSPKQRIERLAAKPPLPKYSSFHLRKGTYHATLDFIQSLCDTSTGLVDVYPMEDRQKSLHESLAELNTQLVDAQNDGGVCFPLGKGLFRVVHIPEDEATLLNSREKAPYLICVEVLKCDEQSNTKGAVEGGPQKLSQGGIPLANGDVQLQRPPPWAYPVWHQSKMQHNNTDAMLRAASQAIDRAMTHLWETKVKFVHVGLSVSDSPQTSVDCTCSSGGSAVANGKCSCSDKEDGASQCYSVAAVTENGGASELHQCHQWVRVHLTAVPGVNMEDVEAEEPGRRKDHRRVPSTVAMAQVKAAAAKGESPLGLPRKKTMARTGHGQSEDRDDVNAKATDALAGELWEAKKERIRKTSKFGRMSGWDLFSVIVKSGDDCRQEHLAVQLISHFYDIYQEAGLPLWLRPYEVLVTSSYTALIETIPDTASIHSIKSRNPNVSSLREFFCNKYQDDSPALKVAQRNFVESMAGYSILCYFLQVKDRHNGNLLIDEEGHIIHIDFGFMLSNSPGGVNFESAPFKLTRELLEVMDSDAEGTASEFFDYFKVLCIQGFLTCRKHAERIILLVEMMQDSGFPCFKGGVKTIQNLRKRFHLSLTEEQCVSLVLSLISNSLDAWRTRQYDYYQRVLNGIL
ncbi:hypothetical protein L7F22_027371 [Adiantum nelumboides]|nr:hypothetical protein [Adiantum nelumboides]